MRVGIIGECHNYISHSMLSSTLDIDSIDVVWFIDAEADNKLKQILYGPNLDLGPIKFFYNLIVGITKKRQEFDCRKLCQENRIPYVKPGKHSINNGLPKDMYETPKADFVLVAGCDQILNESGLKLARKKVINYHYSPLPAYRGKFVLFWQWYNCEPYYGYSFHEVDLGVDTGNVIFQGTVPRIDGESLAKASKRVVSASSAELKNLYHCLSDNTVRCLKEEIVSSYYPSKKYHELMQIDKSKSIDEVIDLIERVGRCKLENGLTAGKLIKAVRGDNSEYSINNQGIYVPVKDGIVLVRPFPRIPFILIRLLCGDSRLLSGLK